MTQSKYIRPRLGNRSVTILGLFLFAAITLATKFLLDRESETVVTESMTYSQFASLMWLTGLIYGVAAGGCWLATIVTARYKRWSSFSLWFGIGLRPTIGFGTSRIWVD